MRKYYLEIECYQDDNSIFQLSIVDQRTKNRREKFAKTLKNINIDFVRIPQDCHSRLSLCQDLNMASTKLMNLTNKELYKRSHNEPTR